MSDKPTIVSAEVTDLFNQYNHRVEFEPQQSLVIIYGENGVGKTTFLEIIHALASLDSDTHYRTPFSEAKLEYSDGSILSVKRETTLPQNETDSNVRQIGLDYQFSNPNEKSRTLTPADDQIIREIRETEYLEEIDQGLWLDLRHNTIRTLEDLKERPQFRLPRRKSRNTTSHPQLPERHLNRTYFIRAERLQRTPIRRNRTFIEVSEQNHREITSPIEERALMICTLLREAQKKHSDITQQLDQTFPSRVLTAVKDRKSTPPQKEDLQTRYERQNALREQLSRIVEISLDQDFSLNNFDLQDWESILLETYLYDAESKLNPFKSLLPKVQLIERIANGLLLNKQLRVTTGEGFKIEDTRNGEELPLNSLSSGEKHQLIMLSDLLFSSPEGTLVLIDEPEISLHIAWQLSFIPHIQEIARLTGCHFIIATHSPQIINDQWDKTCSFDEKKIEL